MGVSYFHLAEADPRDHLLKEAITRQVVPAGCLLAGAIVMGQHESGRDPCLSCPCDRDRCGSDRLQKHKPNEDELDPVEIRSLRQGDDASARKLNRMRHLEKLDNLTKKD